MTSLSVALTPCPNDTHVIGAAAIGLLQMPGADLDIELHDIEYLNQAALESRFDITKVSCVTYSAIADEYELLGTGAAVAEGYGPLVLANGEHDQHSLCQARVVTPGLNTTATLLYRLWAGRDAPIHFAPYHEIMDLVEGGEYHAGVVIHEGRFTFQNQNLRSIIDLGDWWYGVTERPLPLGCYVIRRSLFTEFAEPFDSLLRESMRVATAGDKVVDDYIRLHAQEMSDDVIRQHIGLYVNEYTHTLGEAGREAILYLGERAKRLEAIS